MGLLAGSGDGGGGSGSGGGRSGQKEEVYAGSMTYLAQLEPLGLLAAQQRALSRHARIVPVLRGQEHAPLGR